MAEISPQENLKRRFFLAQLKPISAVRDDKSGKGAVVSGIAKLLRKLSTPPCKNAM
jgi:hypothetical protein